MPVEAERFRHVAATIPQIRRARSRNSQVSRITRRSSAEIAAHGACHVSVLGDSAGANIALASVEYLVANNQTVPAAMVLPSPPVDGWWTNPNVAWAGNLPVND